MTEEKKLDSRAKVIIAACEMIGEDPASTLSVRAVASRAGVSMGSLRHHFPTQRALHDAVLATIYDVVGSGEQLISDESVPPRDRLVGCLRQTLAPQLGDEIRRAWTKVFEAFIAPEHTDSLRASYLPIANEGQSRVEHWLSVLAKEGVVADGNITDHARFLNTVLNGLSIERALPSETSILENENVTLYFAVDAVLKSR